MMRAPEPVTSIGARRSSLIEPMADLPHVARSLLAYTLWADRELLQALSKVPEEHLSLHTGTSFGSLLGTLAHVLGSEQVWLGRFLGAPPEFPNEADWTDLAAVQAGFEELWPQLEFFLASLTADQLAGEIAWVSRAGDSYRRPLWEAVVHMSHHSTYHRGQMVSMLRQLGHQPPATDLIRWFAGR
jgi:uncharacterized damage-inducible protein DinB